MQVTCDRACCVQGQAHLRGCVCVCVCLLAAGSCSVCDHITDDIITRWTVQMRQVEHAGDITLLFTTVDIKALHPIRRQIQQ